MRWKEFLTELDRIRSEIRAGRNLTTAVRPDDELLFATKALVVELSPIIPPEKEPEDTRRKMCENDKSETFLSSKPQGENVIVRVDREPDRVVNTKLDVFLTDKDGNPLEQNAENVAKVVDGWQEGDI